MPSLSRLARLIVVAVFCMACLPDATAQEKAAPTTLPGTKPLTIKQPLDEVMVAGIRKFALRALQKSVEERAKKWNRDYSSRKAYEASIAENRDRLKQILGVVDPRVKDPEFELLATASRSWVAGGSGPDKYNVNYVRWRVLRGVTAEGLMLQPIGRRPLARIVAIPDAAWTPEQFCGLDTSDESVPSKTIRQLARHGCEVVIPTIINREDTHSGHPDVGFTNQPHREFVYRMGFEMGRHLVGYEVQKVLAAVDAFQRLNRLWKQDVPIGVVGVGEGGMIALFSAAADPRISSAMVCGYFQKREAVWQEPIYRNVWAQLTEFGDAELASMVAPRNLIVEASAAPTLDGPPKLRPGRRGGAAPGRIAIPTIDSVKAEFEKAKVHFTKLKAGSRMTLAVSAEGKGLAGTTAALAAFLKGLGITKHRLDTPPGKLDRNKPGKSGGSLVVPAKRHERQFRELMAHVQGLLRQSAWVRNRVWANADRSSVDKWVKSTAYFRNHVWEEMIGRLPDPTMPPNVRTRKIIDKPKYTAYEVVIDVYPDVIAAGVLLLPKGMKPGEKRPVVVCQHGLEGTPMSTITETGRDFGYYKAFSVKLAERGFITYAPQNPYRGRDNFRVLQRMSNPLKRSLFSYIIPQHQRTLEWLATLPNVDAARIGFYGLSYGGKTAVRVPPMLVPGKNRPGYCLSICSADFNEWVKKNTSNEDRYSYIFTGEYEIFEWNMGHTANYAELSNLMAPRPFMVERGHDDGVAPDEWVAWEYAKVRRHYVKLGLGDKTEIEFFNGPHSIHGVGTFKFLHKHLKWPEPKNTK